MSEMTIFSAVSRGLTVKAPVPRAFESLEGERGGWHSLFPHSPFDFDRDIERTAEDPLRNWAAFACTTLIMSDVGKVGLNLVQKADGIWKEAYSPSFSPVIKKPNSFQTMQQFLETWVASLMRPDGGNAYSLKERDNRGVVTALYPLDPCLTTTHVARNGDVFYRLGRDRLAGVHDDDVVFPASEIIHHRINPLFHPLVGLSPLFAASLPAMQGLSIQRSSAKFFANMSMPGGILLSPHVLDDELARKYKERWDSSYSGRNLGRVAVLGGGFDYKPLAQNATDSQLFEQLKLSAEMVCSAYHVPSFKVGVGTIPAGQKVSDLNQIYYNDCLQTLMKGIEDLLDEGLGLTTPKDGVQYGTMFMVDDLLMMDQSTLTDVLTRQAGSGLIKIDEGRKKLNYEPTDGGDAAYLQQQNYSLPALAKRDAQADPFGQAKPPQPQPQDVQNQPGQKELSDALHGLKAELIELRKSTVATREDSEVIQFAMELKSMVGQLQYAR